MKTLFNKITKKIILPLVLIAGIEGTTFCQEKSDSSLIKYNIENKQVYEDFKRFMRLQKTKVMATIYHASEYGKVDSSFNEVGFYYKNKELEIDYSPQLYGDSILNIRFFDGPDGSHCYADEGLNGLQNRGFDICTYYNKNGFYKIGFFSGVGLAFGKEKQLSIAKEYTEILKKILHNAGIPKY